MGDPRRRKKKYDTPPHPWQGARIEAEGKLLEAYGLKTKRELWRHHTKLSNFRKRARFIAGMTGERAELLQGELFSKLRRLGILKAKEPSLDDVLSLEIKNFLERRLQTVVYRNGMAHTPKQARQFIIHGHISVGGRKVTIPSFIVEDGVENQLSFASGSVVSKAHVAVPTVEKAKEIAERKEEKAEEPEKKRLTFGKRTIRKRRTEGAGNKGGKANA